MLKKTLTFAALVAFLATGGCYTSRRVAGDDLVGGPLNPYLWVTVPIDTIMSPYQIPKWLADDTDPWTPMDFDELREEYHPTHFSGNSLTRR